MSNEHFEGMNEYQKLKKQKSRSRYRKLFDEYDFIIEKEYNNIVYGLNKIIYQDVYLDLLNYKRILIYKYCNNEYAESYTVTQIASKVNILIYK